MDLVKSVTEAAQQVSAAALTFLAACVYIGVAVSSTTHEVLLLGNLIKLPLLDVQIPLAKFYLFAPFLLVFLHLHLLMLQHILSREILRYMQSFKKKVTRPNFPFISFPTLVMVDPYSETIVRLLFIVLGIIVTMIIPVLLLLLVQVKFSPYHSDDGTSLCHEVLIFLDLLAIWYFVTRNPMRSVEFNGFWWRGALRLRRFCATAAVSVITILTLPLASALVSSSRLESSPLRGWRYADFFNANLSLPGFDPRSSWGADRSSEKSGKEIQLCERNLQKANLAGASLRGSDLRGADLTEARLASADLAGAKFSPSGGRIVRLERADLRGAYLQDADLYLADLRDADLSGAHLERANLTKADLRGARLRGAFLDGAVLEFAQLDMADLWLASLQGSDLASSIMLGANLSRASLIGADLRWADLREARLDEVNAIAADFRESATLGADFRDADLRDSIGVLLKGVDLRGAHLAGIGKGGGIASLELSDVRGVDLGQLTRNQWRDIIEALRHKTGNKREAVVVRLGQHLLDTPDAPTNVPEQMDYHALEGRMLLSDSADESEFQERFSRLLVREACIDKRFAAVLIRDVMGEIAPRRPLVARAVAGLLVDLVEDKEERREHCRVLDSLTNEQKSVLEEIAKEDPLRMDDVSGLFSHING